MKTTPSPAEETPGKSQELERLRAELAAARTEINTLKSKRASSQVKLQARNETLEKFIERQKKEMAELREKVESAEAQAKLHKEVADSRHAQLEQMRDTQTMETMAGMLIADQPQDSAVETEFVRVALDDSGADLVNDFRNEGWTIVHSEVVAAAYFVHFERPRVEDAQQPADEEAVTIGVFEPMRKTDDDEAQPVVMAQDLTQLQEKPSLYSSEDELPAVWRSNPPPRQKKTPKVWRVGTPMPQDPAPDKRDTEEMPVAPEVKKAETAIARTMGTARRAMEQAGEPVEPVALPAGMDPQSVTYQDIISHPEATAAQMAYVAQLEQQQLRTGQRLRAANPAAFEAMIKRAMETTPQ